VYKLVDYLIVETLLNIMTTWKSHLLQEMQRKQLPLLFLGFNWLSDTESKIRMLPTQKEYNNAFKMIEEEQLSTLIRFPRTNLMVIDSYSC
jgi:hypothetical protein